MKTSFIQDWGIFKNETFVCVGMTREEILTEMVRQDFRQDAAEEFASEHRPTKDDTAAAFVWTFQGVSLLWLADWKVDLEHYGDLLHETNHLVFEMARDAGYREEREANAYLQQYLWLNLIRKLNKALDVKSNTRGKQHDRRSTQRKPIRVHRLRPNKKGTGA